MIELENVSMTYPGGNQALKNVNINIEKGEFVFIVGKNCIHIIREIQLWYT